MIHHLVDDLSNTTKIKPFVGLTEIRERWRVRGVLLRFLSSGKGDGSEIEVREKGAIMKFYYSHRFQMIKRLFRGLCI